MVTLGTRVHMCKVLTNVDVLRESPNVVLVDNKICRDVFKTTPAELMVLLGSCHVKIPVAFVFLTYKAQTSVRTQTDSLVQLEQRVFNLVGTSLRRIHVHLQVIMVAPAEIVSHNDKPVPNKIGRDVKHAIHAESLIQNSLVVPKPYKAVPQLVLA